MKWSRKGAKDNRLRLVWSKYYKYLLDDKEYFFKEKAYTTHNDGFIDIEPIKNQTYRNAIKRGNNCKEIVVEENIMAAPLDALTLILVEKYQVSESNVKESIIKTKEIIEKIKEDSTMSAAVEYKMFRKVLGYHIEQIKEGVAI